MMRLERNIRLVDLGIRLGNDHAEIRRRLWIIKLLLARDDLDSVLSRIQELHCFLDSHFEL